MFNTSIKVYLKGAYGEHILVTAAVEIFPVSEYMMPLFKMPNLGSVNLFPSNVNILYTNTNV